MESFTVRSMHEGDKAGVEGVLREYIAEENFEAYTFPYDSVLHPDELCEARVAVADGEVIGVTALDIFPSVEDVLDELHAVETPPKDVLTEGAPLDSIGYLFAGYVRREWSRKGVGRALRESLEDYAIEQGADAIFVEVWVYDVEKDGQRPLQKSGYEEVFSTYPYWPATLDSDAICSVCGDDGCECSGAVYRRWLPT